MSQALPLPGKGEEQRAESEVAASGCHDLTVVHPRAVDEVKTHNRKPDIPLY